MGTSLTSKEPRPAKAAEELRQKLTDFCSSPVALNDFYDEVLARLPLASVPEEPPPLSI
jgi:DEP domain-containing protein 5